MATWPDGIGDSRTVTVFSNDAQVLTPNLPVYFRLGDISSVGAYTESGRLVGFVLEEEVSLRIRHSLEKKHQIIAEVATTLPNIGQVELQVSWPSDVKTIPGILQVVVNQGIRKQINKYLSTEELDNQYINNWLLTTFQYRSTQIVFAPDAESPEKLYLLGPEVQLLVRVRDSGFLFAEQFRPLKWDREQKRRIAGLIIAEQIEWLSSAKTAVVAVQGAADLLKSLNKNTEYFDFWEQYRLQEEVMLKERYKELKPLAYTRFEYRNDAIRFHLFAKSKDFVQPWQDQANFLSVEAHHPRSNSDSNDYLANSVHALSLGTVRSVTSDYIDVDRPDEEVYPPQKGTLRASPRGDAIRLAREQAAYEQLRNGFLPIRHLPQLLAEGATHEITSFRHLSSIKLTNGRTVNDRQSDAIRIALNTEDICVIQGPPGTGKTTVIRAILKALKDTGKRNLLVSSHQHTAVDNALEGLQGYSVVPYRFVDAHRESSTLGREVEAWIAATVNRSEWELEKREGVDPLFEQYSKLYTLLSTVLGDEPSAEASYEVINSALTVYAELLLPEHLTEANDLQLIIEGHLERLQRIANRVQTTEHVDLLSLIKEMPKDVADLDSERAQRTLNRVNSVLQRMLRHGEVDAQLMQRFVRNRQVLERNLRRLNLVDDPSKLLSAIQEAIDALNQLFEWITTYDLASTDGKIQQRDRETREQWRVKFQAWCVAVRDEVNRWLQLNPRHIPSILLKWQENLKSNPRRVRELFEKHADVWGVTCQQTVAYRFGLYDKEFDCVIIDEAARTSPLDMLIPLVRARKIVLVGDHMQLPHVLDYQLEKAFESAAESQAHRELLKMSLFARLYDQLPVSKRIRLNVQYRMNPIISRMVSQIFYADDPLIDGENVINHVNQSNLFHGRSLVWIDTHLAKQRRIAESSQYINEYEAEVVHQCLTQLLTGSKEYEIGVITYYAQQRDYLNRLIKRLPGNTSRIQIGSVDAFQGIEKDVIILSMVRSNKEQKIGFLTSPNRINVSFSRAKRLLVIIGDSETVTSSPYLYSAYKYCQEIESVLPPV